ncbi:hypothetical protein G6H54_000465 [Listeria monocytogenes]|nr:hypothetical protein [Listeria monocytogenes]
MRKKWLVEVIVCDFENNKQLATYEVQTLEDDMTSAIEVAKYLAKEDSQNQRIKSIHLVWIERKEHGWKYIHGQ